MAGQNDPVAIRGAATSSANPPARARVQVIRDGIAAHLPDIDPEETAEWLESFDAALEAGGQQRARYLMLRLLARARERRVGVPSLTSTDYVNTIPTENEPWFPGDEEVERTYRRWIRWNAAIMVHRAQRKGVAVGGHLSTYASSAALYEVGFNWFFLGRDHPSGGDQVFIQGHASPGIYAGRSWRAGCRRSTWTGSGRSSRTRGRAAGCRRIRTRG